MGTMKNRLFMMMFCAMMVGVFLAGGASVRAGDLDDGISKYKDESISADDEATKTDKNISFIVQKAISSGQKKRQASGGDDNENSIVVGEGANVRGDIINIVAPDRERK